MEKQATVPKDIQNIADKLYPQIVRPSDGKIIIKEGKSDYVRGRLDERNGDCTTPVDIQHIARELLSISWINVQCDDVHENFMVARLLNEIEKLPKEDGLRLMLHVIEVKGLMLGIGGDWDSEENPFRNMSTFPYIHDNIKNFPTDDFKELI